MQTLQQLLSGELIGTKKLKLSCGLTEFPSEIFTLAGTLELLDLSGNQLSQLPEDFGRLKNLKIVFFSGNDFTVFPEVLSQCPLLDIIGFKANKIASMSETALPANTRWLILTNNKLEALPKSIGKCWRMQKLMLAGNRLKTLPEELAACKNLQLLRISANQFTTIPEWLFSMPSLSWLAFAGNPCTSSTEINLELETIDWNELTLTHQLGEGASGIISKADWQGKLSGNILKEVAVKVFKGEVTSDGLPADEMAACITAGSHPNLVTVLGKIHQHPQQKQGLVLELIPPHFTNLGGPPSFETCTRDVYPTDTVFTIQEVITISLSIASAAAHLHERGVSHGDLYAHNILIDEAANALFGDFGAATIYGTNHPAKNAIERLEVSAFGFLLDDLLQYATYNNSNKDYLALAKLTELQLDCVQPNVLQRPSFKEIALSFELLDMSFEQ